MAAKAKDSGAAKGAQDFIGIGLLTPDEVANLLQVTVTTLQNWRYTGRGPVFSRVGGIIRYTRHDVNRFVSESRQSITGQPLALSN